MPDIIHRLPDNIANQIAAGEVIQRPASAVKELMENAIDAGATQVKLVVQDAGKSLIQVIDNGKGMSAADARMAFERHATSKIRTVEDLFRIATMGFRGEALASIAAVSQVEIKTRRAEDETGVCLEIDNSAVRREEPVACAAGTNIAMKNLFFNVPARRNFLRSNAAEMRHIADEFIRVALAFPGIAFVLVSNGQETFHLERGSLKQRIVQVLGAQYASKLVSVKESTDYLNIEGFVGKPEAARKTRGDQYFFVNNRFIRSGYLNHALMTAFQEMIPADSFPLYVLFIEIDPARVDINVHPTKQEIKFEDEKLVYAFVQAAVRHALAQFSITPSLEFDLDPEIQRLDAVARPYTAEARAGAEAGSLFRTFTQKNQAHRIEPSEVSELPSWRAAAEEPLSVVREPVVSDPLQQPLFGRVETAASVQIQLTYLICQTENGFLLVHQQSAHERVLYEQFQRALHGKKIPGQAALFPASFPLAPGDAALLTELIGDLAGLGYLIEPFGKDHFIIQATPGDLEPGNEVRAIEQLLERCKNASADRQLPLREKMIRSLAAQRAVKPGTALDTAAMQSLIAALFACDQPNISPSGKPVFADFNEEYLSRLFGRLR